jgi:hypothetical protein
MARVSNAGLPCQGLEEAPVDAITRRVEATSAAGMSSALMMYEL